MNLYDSEKVISNYETEVVYRREINFSDKHPDTVIATVFDFISELTNVPNREVRINWLDSGIRRLGSGGWYLELHVTYVNSQVKTFKYEPWTTITSPVTTLVFNDNSFAKTESEHLDFPVAAV